MGETIYELPPTIIESLIVIVWEANGFQWNLLVEWNENESDFVLFLYVCLNPIDDLVE